MIDLNKLKKGEELKKRLKVIIVPQGPLSIIGEVNTKYKKLSDKIPENMIYGMLENLLGYHLNYDLRKRVSTILKLKGHGTNNLKKGSEFLPIIKNVCVIKNVGDLEGEVFTDLFPSLAQRNEKMSSNGADVKSHFSGIKDKSISRDKYDSRNPKHHYRDGKLAMFYTTMQKRDYLLSNSSIEIIIETNDYLCNDLLEKNKHKKSAYLGNSESIVNVYIEKI